MREEVAAVIETESANRRYKTGSWGCGVSEFCFINGVLHKWGPWEPITYGRIRWAHVVQEREPEA